MFTGNSRLLSWKLKIMRSCIKFMFLDDIYHLLKSCQHDDLHIFMFLSRHLSPSISCQIKHLNPNNSFELYKTKTVTPNIYDFMTWVYAIMLCEAVPVCCVPHFINRKLFILKKRQIGFPIFHHKPEGRR